MISKVFSGHSFYHACRYICKDQTRSVVLEAEGVRGHDYRLMAEDFARQHELRPSKQQACFHSILSFYPGENPGDEKMAEIGRKYLEEIGILNTQYVIVKHTDKEHLHLHILANMINNDGETISDSWIGFRAKKAAQALTLEYDLTQALKKDLTITHTEAMTPSEANKYKIYKAISEILPHCRTMKELEEKLSARGIETLYKYKGDTNVKQGISFRIGNDRFKGSKIDRRFSLGNLEKTLELQLKKVLEQKQQMPGRSQKVKASGPENPESSRGVSEGNSLAKDIGTGISRTLETLIKPEQNQGQSLPRELTQENRRRKRIKRHL